ncbi:FAD-dependent urate hydroxylase HpxO [Kushneria aurantia]|uniref:FAD-dependent urate hydroxylase n=1 Tax=Kushneria aurantia TaxID=504092 RepID=A0ABV6G3F0_9GAMM|nr:FAD-dependent urate hydroxylase HpxO [Kushneria aurantia]
MHDIIIVGAGMGGLTAALALMQRGHRVQVIERVRELRPAGAAISVWSNGVHILDRLGVGDEIRRAAGHMTHMAYRGADDMALTEFSLAPLYEAVGTAACPIARTELQRILLDAVGRDNVRLGCACVDLNTDDDGVEVVLEGGERLTADLLVAADGTHSALRERILGHPIERRYRGYVNWNVSVPLADDLVPATHWVQYVGQHQRVSMMPMGGDAFYCFFDVPLPPEATPDPAGYRHELARHFAGWPAPVQRLIERFDESAMARVAIHDIDPLPTLVGQRALVMGDAGHGMAPDLGQGGCQAMEDGWVLAQALDEANGDIARALAAWDRARAERVGDIVLRARSRAAMIHGGEPERTRQWYEELAREDGRHIIAGMQKTMQSGPLP